MSSAPPSNAGGGGNRLNRCIRDLAALNALPSMCIGRTPDETLEIMLDALPTVLGCDLVYIDVPGSPPKARAILDGANVSDADLPALAAALGTDASPTRAIPAAGEMWCYEAELPFGHQRGTFIAGRREPMDPETDRVLVRSAANLVGTTLESARVLEAARRKDEFLAMLGHELRNPLAPIVTALELLARNGTADRERQVIEKHTRHLARLVDDLLDISRVTRGHVELRREAISLASVLERAVEIVAPLITRNRHKLYVAQVEDVTIQGDAVRLAQIFGNLLNNAAKFTPPGGNISVGIERSGDRVRVSVRDDGVGIAREQVGRIFEPFVQIDRDPTALTGGLGLGLAIVANLVNRHGGSIVAKSEGRGRGATFVVELPTIAKPEVVPASEVVRPTTGRNGVRVLVVDDNVDIAELLSEALQHEGFETAIAHDGRAAIDAWRRFEPHAAVLDVGLPDLDGYDLARHVRAQHGKKPTLIAATGYGQQSDRKRAADAGFDCHFVKPVSVRDLVLVLDERVVRAAS